MEKDKFYSQAIAWTKRQGYVDIKANCEEYETPAHFSRPGEDEPYIPDITGKITGNKSYVEIAVKNDNVSRTVSKWKLLSTMATMKGGKLFLLAPKGHKAFVEKVVKKHRLNAKLISLT